MPSKIAKDPEVRRASYRRRRQTEGYKRNRQQYRKRHRRRLALRQKFGISVQDYDVMFVEQNGVCKICGRPELTGRWLAVDHDHDGGHVRDLLCLRCNAGIGFLCDSPELLLAAAAYLQAWGK